MKEISFITGNKSKFKEAEEIMKEINVKLTQEDLKFNEVRSTDQEKVVIEKARNAFNALKKPVITDDTAIYFSAYNKFPGTYTNYVFESLGFEGILRLLKGKSRKAYFKTILCYKDKKTEKIFSGIWEGTISPNVKGNFNPDWQYNGIFVPKGSKKFLSQISIEERAKNSHRKKAFNKLIKELKGGNLK